MYGSLFKIIRSYWSDYGGLRELLLSPFTHIGAVITVLFMFGVVNLDWRQTAIGSLPTILGFSLAAYTITFTLMGSALHRALSSAVDRKSGAPLIRQVNATFFHVVLFQAIGLIYAIVTSGTFFWDRLGGKPGLSDIKSFCLGITYYIGNAIGCFLSLYSFLLLFSVSFAMYRLGRLTGNVKVLQVETAPDIVQDNASSITKTRRFALVRILARILRIYH